MYPDRIYSKCVSGDTIGADDDPANAESAIVIWDHTTKRTLVFDEYSKFSAQYTELPSVDRTYHERVYAGEQKFRFDFDKVVESRTIGHALQARIVDSAVAALADELYASAGVMVDESTMAICSSSGPTSGGYKVSVHVIATESYAESYDVVKKLCLGAQKRMPPDVAQCVDDGIYGRVRNFRLPFAVSINGQREKRILTEHTFEQCLVGKFFSGPKVCGSIEVKKISSNAPLDQRVVDAAIAHDPSFIFEKMTGGIYSFSRIAPSMCSGCGRMHERDNSMFAVVKSGQARILCRRNTSRPLVVVDLADAVVADTVDAVADAAVALPKTIRRVMPTLSAAVKQSIIDDYYW